MSLAGRLEDLALSDIFQILSIGRKTGIFTAKGSRGSSLIVFKNGLIVRAETDDLEGSIGEDLDRAGLVKNTVLGMALELKKKLPVKSTAEIIYELGSVSRDAIEKAAKKRIEKVISTLLRWEDGDFQFELDDLQLEGKTSIKDLGFEVSRGLSPEYLLMEGARMQDESTQLSFVPDEEFGGGTHEEEAGWDEDWESAVQPERKDITALKSLTMELRFPNSASEITLLILRFASDIFNRGVLFMVGDTDMVGLGQFGLEIDRAEEKVRGTVLHISDSPFFSKIIRDQIPYRGPIGDDDVIRGMMEEFGGLKPAEAAVIPVIAEGHTAALLVCDNAVTGDPIGETEGLEIFVSHAGLALEKSLLQRRLREMEKGV